jgi:Co/Zn/Cd efflux system component
MALWVFGSTVYQTLILGVPSAEVMGIIGFMALAANLASVGFLMPYKDGDANVRSVCLCSHNDAIGNMVVMAAALGVWSTSSARPDLAVAGLMAGPDFSPWSGRSWPMNIGRKAAAWVHMPLEHNCAS